MKKKFAAVSLMAAAAFSLAACGGSSTTATTAAATAAATEAATTAATEAATTAAPETTAAETTAEEVTAAQATEESTEVIVFAAASLTSIMEDFERDYEAAHPGVDVVLNTDSSGTLLNQIKEGAPCDIFFSAGQAQVNTLESEGMLIDGTRKNVVNNQLIVITQPDSETAVTGLEDLDKAESIALADGSVPVGRYTRVALMNLGILEETEKPQDYTTQEVSDALGGVEISEQGNVSKVRTAVEEGSCEVGTVYYSDIYQHEDKVKVLQVVSYDVSGNIIYPVCMVQNEDADETETKTAADFLAFITNDDAKALYEQYLFDPNV